MMENLFSAVIRLSIMGSYVILVILFARLLLKKAPKWISYALWLAAGWRLILPLSISNPLSLIPKRTENSLLVIDELVSTVIGERRVNRGTYEPIFVFHF
jgi:beta-lactamase regulating signal transducer with metallopeptidase domain